MPVRPTLVESSSAEHATGAQPVSPTDRNIFPVENWTEKDIKDFDDIFANSGAGSSAGEEKKKPEAKAASPKAKAAESPKAAGAVDEAAIKKVLAAGGGLASGWGSTGYSH